MSSCFISQFHEWKGLTKIRAEWKQGSKLLGFRMSGTPKKTQFLDQVQGFRPESQELSGGQTALNLGVLTGNPEIAREIQILRQVFRMETQIFIVISSPVGGGP